MSSRKNTPEASDSKTKPARTRPPAKRNKTTAAFLVSDNLWELIRPLLPERVNTHRFGGGKPPADDRKCLDGILFVLRTGCQWNAPDATGICPSSTAHDRFQKWVRSGVFLRFWQAGLMEYDELKGLDWDWLCVDGAMGKAPLGGGENRGKPHRPGQAGEQAQPSDGSRRGARGTGHRGGQPT